MSRRRSPFFRLLLMWSGHALQNIRTGLLIHLASTTSIALSLLLMGLAMLGMENVDRLTHHWGRGVQIIVYLKAEAPPVRVSALTRLLKERPEVSSVNWISPKEAHARLRASLGQHKGVLDSVELGFLPASLEIAMRQDQPDRARALVSLLSASSLVEEVDYMGDWARRLETLVTLIRALGLGLAFIISLACLYIVGSTIRLGVHARKEEIEIMRLVGATNTFIRAPFMIEGALQGLVGALLAWGLLYLIYIFGAPKLEAQLSFIFNQIQVGFLPPKILLAGLASGTLLGLLGSRLALGRYIDL